MYSIVDLAGSNGQSNFGFSFGYLDQAHIHMYIDGDETTEFTFSSAFVVTLDTPLSGEHDVRVRRITPVDEPAVDFVNGSVLGETDLDYSSLQLLYSQQEIADGFESALQLNDDGVYDANDIRIAEVGTPVQPTDAATKEYVDTSFAESADGHALEAHNNVDNGMVHAKGDLLAWDSTAEEWVKVAVGTDGKTLEADSSVNHGISWQQGIRKVITTAGDLLQGTSSGVAERLAATARGAVLILNASVKAAWKAIGAKGSILCSDGTDPQYQTVGNNDDVLIADSAQTNGLKWGTAVSLVPAASETVQGKVELATSAEVITGSDTARAVTPAGLKAALGISKFFDTGELAATADAGTTTAHGLGGLPKLMYTFLRCKTAEHNYAIGDEVAMGPVSASAGSGYQVFADATNIYTRVDIAISLLNSSFVAANITHANWRIIVRAWA